MNIIPASPGIPSSPGVCSLTSKYDGEAHRITITWAEAADSVEATPTNLEVEISDGALWKKDTVTPTTVEVKAITYGKYDYSAIFTVKKEKKATEGGGKGSGKASEEGKGYANQIQIHAFPLGGGEKLPRPSTDGEAYYGILAPHAANRPTNLSLVFNSKKKDIGSNTITLTVPSGVDVPGYNSGIHSIDGSKTITAKLKEGETAPQTFKLKLENAIGYGSAEDSVVLLPVELDVARIAHNAASGELDDSKKESTGAFVPLNSDDDDYSATLTNLGSDKDQTGALTGENDLLPIYLRKIPQLTGAKFLLDIPSTIKVWKNSNRQDQVIATTELDATVDTTVYAEGVSKGSDLLKLTLRHGGQDQANITRIKITVFELKGALNVPGYTAYSYTADGSLPNGSKWGTPTSGTLKPGSTAAQATILWDQGPVVGKANYEVSSDYVWDLEVNVVQVKLATGDSNKVVYVGGSYQNPQNKQQIISSTGKAMQAILTIEKVIGPSVFGSTRGEQFLQIGFIQNGQFTRTHALYNGLTPMKRKRSSLEDGVDHIDYFTLAPASTPPWYDSANATGSNGFDQVPAGGADNVVINVSDTPRISATDSMMLSVGTVSDMADKFAIEFDLNLYFAVRTVQDVNGSKDTFTQRGKASWKFDGSGDINASGVWTQTGTGNTGSSSFAEITNGDVVPVTTGTAINTLLISRTFVTENQ